MDVEQIALLGVTLVIIGSALLLFGESPRRAKRRPSH
jgi:hypothetical protein